MLPLRPRDKEARESGRYCTCGAGDKQLIGSSDPAWVEATWAARPDANLGVVCGERSRLLVLDVDVKRDGHADLVRWRYAREGEGKVLPDHPTVTTATGGHHHWFRLPAGRHVRRNDYWLPGVEVKACGGYVACPPSVRDLPYTYEEDGFLIDDVVTRCYSWDPGSPGLPDAPGWLLRDVVERFDGLGRSRRGGPVKNRDGSYSVKLPPTEEFLERGLGWFYGSRNEDAHRLSWRLWTKLGDRAERAVEGILRACWEATPDQTDSSWHEIWQAALSAKRRVDDQRRRDQERVNLYLRRGGRTMP